MGLKAINQMFMDPWSQVKGYDTVWAVCDDGIYCKIGDDPFVEFPITVTDPEGYGATYDDIKWICGSGDICHQDRFVFVGRYDRGWPYLDSHMVVGWIDGGESGTAWLETQEYIFTPFDWGVMDPVTCSGKVGGTCDYTEGAQWIPNDESNSFTIGPNWQGGDEHLCAVGFFAPPGILVSQDLPRHHGIKIWARATGTWYEWPGGQCFQISVTPNQSPCAGGTVHLIGTWDSTGYGNVSQEISYDWPEIVTSVYVTLRVIQQFGGPPAGSGWLIDGIWAEVPPVQVKPYGCCMETQYGQYAYITGWTITPTTEPSVYNYPINLFGFDFVTKKVFHIDGLADKYGGVGIGGPNNYHYNDWTRVYPHHPYGFPFSQLIVYGGETPLEGKENVIPVAKRLWIAITPTGGGVAAYQDLISSLGLSAGHWVGHLSAATLDYNDLVTFVNDASFNLYLYRSYNLGAGWESPKTLPSGMLRWNAAHRFPGDGDRILYAPTNMIYETPDGGVTNNDIRGDLGDGSPGIRWSAFYKWWIAP